MGTLRRVIAFYKRDFLKILAVIFLIIVSTLFSLLKPWPLAIIVDSILGDKPLPEFLTSLAIFTNASEDKLKPIILFSSTSLFFYIVHSFISTSYNYLSIKIGLKGLQRVRTELFLTLQHLSLKFHHGKTIGDLIYRASWDAYSVQTIFQQGFISTIGSVVSLLLMFAVMSQLNLRLTLISALMIPVLIVSLKIFGKKMMQQGIEAQKADSDVITSVQQTIVALPLIQSFTREEVESRKFDQRTKVAFKQRLAQHYWELVYCFSATAFFSLVISSVLLVGAIETAGGRLSVGELLVFLAYLGQFYEPLNQITHAGSTAASALAGAKRLFEIMDSKEDVVEKPDAIPVVFTRQISKTDKSFDESRSIKPLIVQGKIEFDDVWFCYRDNQYVLKGIKFNVFPGERVAVIGPSGAGKTTLMNLVPRFYDPVRGSIKLDGIDLRGLRLRDLRKNISVVLQNPLIIPSTVRENIAYGCPDAKDEEIELAAKMANAHLFIEKLPQKYNTVIGEGGVELSAGEAQRINIARAFLKDAPILLMDEPTSALDIENEAIIIKTIFELMKNRTTLIIAHRIETIRKMDKIIVLQDGTIAQIGAPAELESEEGYYSRLISGIL
ncbi:MAG: ABC transporter ATP-binding protein [Verrucomicrobiia bacterium]